MESAAGPLRNAYPDRVLESKAPGVPLDSSVPGRGPRTQPQAPRGDRAGAPHPSPEPHPCPGSAFLPATPHPGEQRALGVRLGPASSALAAPGQPRDSARWMLCVAGAKLKVSGVWARSSASAGVGGWRGVCLGASGADGFIFLHNEPDKLFWQINCLLSTTQPSVQTLLENQAYEEHKAGLV